MVGKFYSNGIHPTLRNAIPADQNGCCRAFRAPILLKYAFEPCRVAEITSRQFVQSRYREGTARIDAVDKQAVHLLENRLTGRLCCNQQRAVT